MQPNNIEQLYHKLCKLKTFMSFENLANDLVADNPQGIYTVVQKLINQYQNDIRILELCIQIDISQDSNENSLTIFYLKNTNNIDTSMCKLLKRHIYHLSRVYGELKLLKIIKTKSNYDDQLNILGEIVNALVSEHDIIDAGSSDENDLLKLFVYLSSLYCDDKILNGNKLIKIIHKIIDHFVLLSDNIPDTKTTDEINVKLSTPDELMNMFERCEAEDNVKDFEYFKKLLPTMVLLLIDIIKNYELDEHVIPLICEICYNIKTYIDNYDSYNTLINAILCEVCLHYNEGYIDEYANVISLVLDDKVKINISQELLSVAYHVVYDMEDYEKVLDKLEMNIYPTIDIFNDFTKDVNDNNYNDIVFNIIKRFICKYGFTLDKNKYQNIAKNLQSQQ